MNLPSHPETGDPPPVPNRTPATSPSRATVLVVAVVATLIALIVILHLTGVVGPAAR